MHVVILSPKIDSFNFQKTLPTLSRSGAADAKWIPEKDFGLEHFILLAIKALTYYFENVPLRLITTALVLPIRHLSSTPHMMKK